MKRTSLAILIAAAIVAGIFSGCTSNILVRKNGQPYFLATKQKGLKPLLCDSGDLEVILKDTKLENRQQDDIRSSICAESFNREKTLEVLSGLTREEREDFKGSLERHGYHVNNLC